MEQIDGCCHRFERLRQKRHQHMCTIQPNDPHIQTVAFQSLDTVRALHQTVVSLRKALEEANREIDSLKKQITVKDDIEEGKKYREQESTESNEELANFPLTIDLSTITDTNDRQHPNPDVTKPQAQTNRSSSTILNNNENRTPDYVPLTHRSTKSLNSNEQPFSSSRKTTTKKQSRSTEHFEHHIITHDTQHKQLVVHPIKTDIKIKTPDIQTAETSIALPNRRLPQMASKIDVKIKLTSNFKIDGSDSSSEATGDSNSETVTPRESSDDTGNDKANTHNESSEAAEVEDNMQSVPIVTTSAENENVQIDDTKSEPNELEQYTNDDGSVSGDGGDDGDDGAVGGIEDDSVFVDEAIPSTSKAPNVIVHSSPNRSSCDNDEEVDDIELILSSDDKEFPQEDLVSISYYEPWQLCGQSGTPILVHFNNISSDNEGVDDGEGREKLSPSPIDPDQFYNAIKENVAQQQLSLESSDSLSLGENLKRSYDFNTKSSSLEKESDAKTSDENCLIRDESFDTFEQARYSSAMGRRWTNYNVFQETDISKIGTIEEGAPEKGRRNTCPNPTAYRPIIHREAIGRFLNNNNNNNNNTGTSMVRCPLAVKFARSARTHLTSMNNNRGLAMDPGAIGPKRSSAAQTEISLSTLPEHWRSESHLMAGLGNGFFTLPSKFVKNPGVNVCKHPLKVSEKTREARRVLLSDINFTSMVPELSRSADHLCHGEEQQNIDNNNDDGNDYSKGPFLKTPDYANRGITPSMSLTSPGVSQWTVNESSFGTQTMQTDNNWSVQHGDSFDSCKSYSIGSKLSFGKHNRSRSCPSVRCALCKHRHHGGIKMSESMHYTPRVTFQEVKTHSVRGSLPDLRPECACGCPRSRIAARSSAFRHGDSCGSTESILDEAEDFLRESIDGVLLHDSDTAHSSGFLAKGTSRRCSENDINKKDFSPSKQTLPFLPKSSANLKPGHLAKVIAKNGRVVIGRVRYVGPLASNSETAGIDNENETYVGLQLPNKIGDCNGSFEGRKFFDCEPQHGIFVPFQKIVMAWTS